MTGNSNGNATFNEDEESILSAVDSNAIKQDIKLLDMENVSSDAETEKLEESKDGVTSKEKKEGGGGDVPRITDLLKESHVKSSTNVVASALEGINEQVNSDPLKESSREPEHLEQKPVLTEQNELAAEKKEDFTEKKEDFIEKKEVEEHPKENSSDKPIDESPKEPSNDEEINSKLSESVIEKNEVPSTNENHTIANEGDADEEEGDEEDNDNDVPLGKKDEPSQNKTQTPVIDEEAIRLNALQEMTQIEHAFASVRQRLYEHKLTKLETELKMCLDGSHPDLQSYYQIIQAVRDDKLRRAYHVQKYSLHCISKETHASRTMVHQDFYRRTTQLRAQLLQDTTQQWYDINKERREIDAPPSAEPVYHVPVKVAHVTLSCVTGYAGPAQPRLPGEPISEDVAAEGVALKFRANPVDKLEVIVDRMRLNNQLSDLQGLDRYYHGFPGAPDLAPLRDSEVADDLAALRNVLHGSRAG
ncbi:hypothetical protein TBLA_0E02230 [Henningerozyma blattae CBS 6284]|uniref:Transcriptional regulatory protein DEP1 n=1 Tax=Henningerozyma blattae (strain ATCC 34711 / CBS 6284 / DSM 70876 / NBRC 10599 / NRRL Y-10934 / UCD 77-7) TaxID=1071380 RepID=I2H4H4_HENB6|nr:hypothetical protein TBLA_0E02230 [Tetrapisispora blattae CBS 6284]CCH61276.1 hypothetical protein TBLA_0E02230 [Tetrapisispora blattae CBS 6284]